MKDNCYFCGNTECKDCILPYTDQLYLVHLLDKITAPDFQLCFKIVWHHTGASGV